MSNRAGGRYEDALHLMVPLIDATEEGRTSSVDELLDRVEQLAEERGLFRLHPIGKTPKGGRRRDKLSPPKWGWSWVARRRDDVNTPIDSETKRSVAAIVLYVVRETFRVRR